MSDLGDELERAVGDSEPALDVAALQARAGQRVRTRRRALAAGACAVLVLAGAAAWTASTGDGGTQQVAAGDGGAGELETTTTVIDETTTIFTTTEDTTTTAPGPPSTLVTAPPDETTTSSTTEPPTTTVRPAGPGTVEVRGTYTGQERYKIDRTECGAKDMDISHGLVSRFTPTQVVSGAQEIGPGGWDFKSDYCSRIQGDTWSGSGSWAISFGNHAGITGTVEDQTAYPTDGEPYQLVIEGGSDQFTGATGTCDLTVRITDKVFGSQTQSGEFHCVIQLPEADGGAASTRRLS